MSIQNALRDLASGKIIMLLDDNDRENEGDFIQAARYVTSESVNFMITHGRGMVCQPITRRRADELQLPMQVSANTALHHTAFTVSVDYVHGTTTGISASDRAKTIAAVENSATPAADLARPGHIFPIVAKDGGVRERRGHTEASIDLVRLADAGQSAVICEILRADGEAARTAELNQLAEKHRLVMIHIKELVEYLQRYRYS